MIADTCTRTARAVVLFLVCTLALWLALPVTASHAAGSTDPTRRVAVEQAGAEAASLLEKGQADQAFALFMRLVVEAPEDETLQLGLARAATKAGKWNQAVLAYEMLLEKHPREAGLYSELANVYMLLGDRDSAERSLAMYRSLVGTATKEDTDKALDMLQTRYSRFQAHGKLRLGMLYDSNANMGPHSNTVDLGNWRVSLDGARRKSSFGGYLGADVDMGWRTAQDSNWWLVGDVQAYLRGYTNSSLHENSRSRESQYGRAAFGVRHLTATTLADLRLKADIFDYETYQNVASIGPEGTFLWAATPKIHLISKGGIDRRVYSRNSERNGAYGWLGQYVKFIFGSDNHEVIAGARYVGGAADFSDYSYNGWEGTLRFLFRLPHNFEFSPFATFTQEFYKGPGTALETDKRQDNRWRIGTSLVYNIDEAWSVETSYQYTTNESVSNLYDYDQHLVTTGIAWRF